jgi:large subunit ribosomal protein L21
MTYAIVSIGGKQYRVQEGERLLVDRLSVDADKTFHPDVLFLGGDGDAQYAPKGAQVTARVVQHVRGDKITIGKHRQRTGYRRHTGFRSALSEIHIEAIGKKAERAAPAKKAEPKVEEKPKPAAKAAPKPAAKAAPKPKAAAKPAAKKAPAKKTREKK